MSAPQLPSRVAVARMLCGLVGDLRTSPDNFERQSLQLANELLDREPPAVDAARSELADAVEHAFRGLWVESRPEATVAAAAWMLLRDEGELSGGSQ